MCIKTTMTIWHSDTFEKYNIIRHLNWWMEHMGARSKRKFQSNLINEKNQGESMKGVIQFIETGSFKGNDGNIVNFTSVVVDRVKYTCYNKSMKEKKIGDEIEFEKVDKGEGKTPQMKLMGEQQGFKKEWKQQDPDGMYRCNAMTNAVAFFKGDNIEGLITTYNAIYKAMKGDVVNTATNVSIPAVLILKLLLNRLTAKCLLPTHRRTLLKT